MCPYIVTGGITSADSLCPFTGWRLFLCNRKFRWNPLLHRKSPTGQDPEAAERQMSLKRPAAGGKSCKKDSFSGSRLLGISFTETVVWVTGHRENRNSFGLMKFFLNIFYRKKLRNLLYYDTKAFLHSET